jgi:hypothetical protein
VWVNKLNAFEVQEARADGSVRRSERMYALAQPDSPEKLGFDAEVSTLSHEQLADRWVEAYADDIYLDVINDIEANPEWRERRERIERLPAILNDADVEADDPRRAQLTNDQAEWVAAIQQGVLKGNQAKRTEGINLERADLVASLWERYRQRQTMDVFMAERRVTQLYFSMRECAATDLSTEIGKHEWDHSNCDHSKRLLDERAQARKLPDAVIEKIEDELDDMTINPRAAGNSGAPASSSASSEPASAEAAGSTPSTPAAT